MAKIVSYRSLIAAASLTALATPSFAQSASSGASPPSAGSTASDNTGTELQTIIVTARRREENLQKVPVAATVVSPQQIAQFGAFDAHDLSQLAPGLNTPSGVSDRNDVVFTIRGQGQTFGTLYPSVIPYFAGVPLNNLSTGYFYDLQSVQVLRGPQGTLFGRNTDGGAIVLTPTKPSEDFGGFVKVQVGDYGLNEYTAALNIPINDKIDFRGAFDIARRDGFTTDVANGEQLDNVNYNSFRGSIVFRPFEGFENDIVVSYYAANENGDGYKLTFLNPSVLGAGFTSLGLPPATVQTLLSQAEAALTQQNALGPRATNLAVAPSSLRRYAVVSDTATYEFTPDLTIKNIFGYVRGKEINQGDYDGSDLSLVTSFQDPPEINYGQFTDDLQLLGKTNNFTWVGGLYFDYEHPAGFTDPNSFTELEFLHVVEPTEVTTRSQAVYGQGTYDFSDYVKGLRFTAGVRYTRDTVSEVTTQTINGTTCQVGVLPDCTVNLGTANFHAITYNLDLEYQLDPSTLLYVANRRGYKSGGFNVSFPTPNLATYQPEILLDEEIGLKRDWHFGDFSARTNVDAYRGAYDDSQKIASIISGAQLFTVVENVPSATVEGVEFDGLLLWKTGLSLELNGAYTDAHYNVGIPGFPVDTHFNATPRYQLTANVGYKWELGGAGDVRPSVTYYYQSTEFLTDSIEMNNREPGYSLVNLQLAWERPFGRPVTAMFFMTNVTNKVYRVGVDDIDEALGASSSLFGPPRMFGVSLEYKFGGG
jgi:iron complex outermembrane receptor protein